MTPQNDDGFDFDKFKSRMKKLVRKTEGVVDWLQNEVNLINDLLKSGRLGPVTSGAHAARTGFGKGSNRHYRNTFRDDAYAVRGAESFDLLPNGDGTFKALIDGRPLILQPRLAELLRALAENSGPSDDHLVARKKVSDVIQRLENIFGVRITPEILSNDLYKLRNELEEQANLSRKFIQRNRVGEIRFALQRKASGGPEGDAL